MRLIDADALETTLIMKWKTADLYQKRQRRNAFSEAMSMLLETPTVDPVKHGHWIVNGNGTISCPYCKKDTNEVLMLVIKKDKDGEHQHTEYEFVKPPYCQWCGTKLYEVSE